MTQLSMLMSSSKIQKPYKRYVDGFGRHTVTNFVIWKQIHKDIITCLNQNLMKSLIVIVRNTGFQSMKTKRIRNNIE